MPSSIRCHRCKGPLTESDSFCPVCGAKSLRAQTYPESVRHFAPISDDLKRRVETLFAGLRYRYGTLPAVSLLGLLPLIPLSSLIGIGAGVFGLIRIVQRRSPTEGVPLALLGIIGAMLWFVVGIFAIGQLGEMLNLVLQKFLDALGLIYLEAHHAGSRSA